MFEMKNLDIAYEKTSKKRRQQPFFIEIPGKNLVQSFFLKQDFFINYNRKLSNMPSLSLARTLLQYWDSRFIRITWDLWIIQLVFEFIVIQLIYFFSNSWKFMRFGNHSHRNSWIYKFTFIEVHGFSNSYS